MTEVVRKDWYSPSEIIPTVFQLTEFILPNLYDMRNGTWPPDPLKIGQPGYDSKVNYIASFIPAAELAAEIDQRLAMIGPTAFSLLGRYSDNPPKPLKDLCILMRCGEEHLDYEHRIMLGFIAGSRRKDSPYRVWKAVVKMRKSKHFDNKTLDKQKEGA